MLIYLSEKFYGEREPIDVFQEGFDYVGEI